MKLRAQKPDRSHAEGVLVELLDFVDRTIPAARTVLLIAGVAAAALQTGASSDFLFTAGLALQFAIWFENWWLATRTS